MTTKQALKKIKEMIKGDGIDYIMHRAEILLNSGGIDKTQFEDNYLLPKIVLHCALLDCAEQYGPLHKDSKKAVANLRHF